MGRSPQNMEFVRLKRRGEVAKLYLQGDGQHTIAEKLGVSTQAVLDDLNWLREQWKNSNLADYQAARAETLAKIDHLEFTYWDAWERSKEPTETTTIKVEEMIKTVEDKQDTTKGKKPIGKPIPTTKMVPYKTIKDTKLVGQVGNQGFLQGVERCIEMRAKIIGLLKDTSVTNNITMNWESLTQAIVLQEGEPLPEQAPLQLEYDPIEAKISKVEAQAVPINIEEQHGESLPIVDSRSQQS